MMQMRGPGFVGARGRITRTPRRALALALCALAGAACTTPPPGAPPPPPSGGGGSRPTGTGGVSPGTGGGVTPGTGGGGNPGTGGAGGGTSPTDATAEVPPTGRPDVAGDAAAAGNFSFFVISMRALQKLSGKPEGFGGDLRFGKADGLAGADELCRQAAEMALPGAGAKDWRALLSATKGGPNGGPVHARDRIGNGPWYSRKGQLFASNLTELFSATRPPATPALSNDITNEYGEPNHYVGATGYNPADDVDNHDTLTGSTAQGMLLGTAADTCQDWTSTTAGSPMGGHSWPRLGGSGKHWVSDHRVPGCSPGIDRTVGGQRVNSDCVGCSGGYGGFYCFAR